MSFFGLPTILTIASPGAIPGTVDFAILTAAGAYTLGQVRPLRVIEVRNDSPGTVTLAVTGLPAVKLAPGDGQQFRGNGDGTANVAGALLGTAPTIHDLTPLVPAPDMLLPASSADGTATGRVTAAQVAGAAGALTAAQVQALIDASQTPAQPLSGALAGADTFLMVRGSGLSATSYTVTAAQLQALLGTAPANSYPLGFGGPAGAPNGIRALAGILGSDVSSAALDGAGNLTLPSAGYRYGMLQAAGPISAVAAITATFKAGTSGPVALGRVDAAGANGGFVVFADNNQVLLVTVTGGTQSASNVPAPALTGHSSVGVRQGADGIWHAQVDGADMANATFAPPAVATGYVMLGSGNAGGASISGISVQ